MNRNSAALVGPVLLFVAFAGPVHAHHAVATHYDRARTIELSGVVVDFQLRSPHTSLVVDVSEPDGTVERWEIEGNSLPVMRRIGIDETTFAPGDAISVVAFPNREPNKRLVFGETYITRDGTTLGEPLSPGDAPPVTSTGIAKLAGRWSSEGPSPGTESVLPLTPVGLDAWRNWDAQASPANTCEPVNVPDVFFAPYLFDVRVNAEEVTLLHEAYGVTRTIILDSEPRLAEETGLFGLVSGRAEGDELVIESSEYPPSAWGLGLAATKHGGGADVPSSAQKKVTERYSVSEDGRTLRIDYTVEDPVYLTMPYSSYAQFTRVPDDTPLYEYNCEVDSASRFSGASR